MNDYTGKLLHHAHYDDLLKEAKGSQMIKEGRQIDEPRPSRSPNRRLVVKLAWAVMAALLSMLAVTATFEPPNGGSADGGSADTTFPVQTGAR